MKTKDITLIVGCKYNLQFADSFCHIGSTEKVFEEDSDHPDDILESGNPFIYLGAFVFEPTDDFGSIDDGIRHLFASTKGNKRTHYAMYGNEWRKNEFAELYK